MRSESALEIQASKMPEKSAASASNGSISTQAKTLVATKNLYGSTAEASLAS
jgi:hypothetical protein